MRANKRVIKPRPPRTTETYQHPEANLPMRPEVGTHAQFKKKKAPQTYRYDSSLSPALEWDGKNPAREAGEALIKEIAECGLRSAELAKESPSPKRDKEVERLKARISECQSRLRRISGPFLNWTGKAERLSFDVPTLPLFAHERLSTKAIIETLEGVTVIDQRGNELLVVKSLKEAEE